MTDSHSNEALSLRVQALALLQRAQQLDGLSPHLLCHSHGYGSTGYLVWASGPDLSEASAAAVLESSFEPEKNESLSIESGISLEEIAGVDITKRVADLDHEAFPPAYRAAIDRMDHGTLQTILEDHAIPVRSSASVHDLRKAVRWNVIDGTISKDVMDIYAKVDGRS